MANVEQDFTNNNDPNWERDTINELLFSAIKEQRSTRRWGIFFKLCLIGYVIIMMLRSF